MTSAILPKHLAKRLGILAAGVAVGALLAGSAMADPAVIYDLGGKFDKSFNEATYNGAERWAKETGGTYHDLEIQAEAQREQAVRKFAQAGYSPIVVTGFSFADTLNKVAPDFPNIHFVQIDSVVNQPNVESVVYKSQDASYLAGVLAAKTSKTG
jgi:basic membrane protein A